jgi:hypothetical protein
MLPSGSSRVDEAEGSNATRLLLDKVQLSYRHFSDAAGCIIMLPITRILYLQLKSSMLAHPRPSSHSTRQELDVGDFEQKVHARLNFCRTLTSALE